MGIASETLKILLENFSEFLTEIFYLPGNMVEHLPVHLIDLEEEGFDRSPGYAAVA